MHLQLAGFVASNSRRDPTKTAYSAATHGAVSVDIAAVSLPQPRLRLLVMVSGNSSRRTPGHPTRANTRTANPPAPLSPTRLASSLRRVLHCERSS
jgi:hypothetical protein